MMKRLVAVCLSLLALGASPLHANISVLRLASEGGPPGTTVELRGFGFDTNVVYRVRIACAAQKVLQVATNVVRITVAAGTTSGPVEISDGGDFVQPGSVFQI